MEPCFPFGIFYAQLLLANISNFLCKTFFSSSSYLHYIIAFPGRKKRGFELSREGKCLFGYITLHGFIKREEKSVVTGEIWSSTSSFLPLRQFIQNSVLLLPTFRNSERMREFPYCNIQTFFISPFQREDSPYF